MGTAKIGLSDFFSADPESTFLLKLDSGCKSGLRIDAPPTTQPEQ